MVENLSYLKCKYSKEEKIVITWGEWLEPVGGVGGSSQARVLRKKAWGRTSCRMRRL